MTFKNLLKIEFESRVIFESCFEGCVILNTVSIMKRYFFSGKKMIAITIRDIAIAFGYEVDEKSEKKVNDSVSDLKVDNLQESGASVPCIYYCKITLIAHILIK